MFLLAPLLMVAPAQADCEWSDDTPHVVEVHIGAEDWSRSVRTARGDTIWTLTTPIAAAVEGLSHGDRVTIRILFEDEVVQTGSLPDAYTLQLGPPVPPDMAMSPGAHYHGRVVWTWGDDDGGLAWIDATTARVVQRAEAWMGWGLVGDDTRCMDFTYLLPTDPAEPAPERVEFGDLTLTVEWHDGDWRGHEPLRLRPWSTSQLFRPWRGTLVVAGTSLAPYSLYAGRPGGTTCPPELDGACLDLESAVLVLESADGLDAGVRIPALPPGVAIELQGVDHTDEGPVVLAPLSFVPR